MSKTALNKSDLIDAIHESVDGITKKQVREILDALVDSVTQSVSQGRDVAISGFGKFTRAERTARQARNPRTGENVRVPASKAPRFAPAKRFKDAVNR